MAVSYLFPSQGESREGQGGAGGAREPGEGQRNLNPPPIPQENIGNELKIILKIILSQKKSDGISCNSTNELSSLLDFSCVVVWLSYHAQSIMIFPDFINSRYRHIMENGGGHTAMFYCSRRGACPTHPRSTGARA